ncbi:FtsX-like permease family protein [candidate division KSB1 bacterium]|nr:FtsX-like permease family protein [candidate division KSB1 bacterium]NIR70856.1 FtsX-like permease family protein [candidate division KSB1 bacterium]NIS24642.1 FtsX-like permease family protein [candidate division KSB1 bacterium]NIT71544.1 FtsX-like permease family protein [candidate division KSB1 bacterium]NIU25242.1 FtsX-like permease family protein [candidate division KSB1 bacterium]
MGKTLHSEDREVDFKVTGVLRNLPHHSHLQFSMLFSLATFQGNEGWQRFLSSWDSDYMITYILLDENTNPAELEAKLPAFLAKHRGENPEKKREITLQPLADIHFRSGNIESDRNASKGEMAYIYIFAAIAAFIVLIACINYMNLATARSINRANEVGLRKVVGAYRLQLVGQFLSESILMTLLSLLLAYVVVQNLLPAFNELTGKELSLQIKASGFLLVALIMLTTLVGLISGSYPAFYLSRIQIVRVLKGKFKAGTGEALFRRGLVVTQFALSIIMIVATIVVFNQMNYVQNKRLGFNEEHLVVVDINSGFARRDFQAIKTEFARNPEVRSVSVSSRVPGEWKTIPEIEVIPEAASESNAHVMHYFGVDEDFLSTFQIKLVDGRNFLETMTTDTSAVLINEAAAEILGWQDPLGKQLRVKDVDFTGRVIGVVKNFHFRSLHEKIGPIVLGHRSNPIDLIDYFTARITGKNIAGTLEHLRTVHEQFDKVTPFEYHFLDQQLANFYETDRTVGQLFGIAAGLAIFIACLGLFGLAAFMAEQRTKEIGVRKVLGASVSQIVLLFSKEFARLVLIALIVASPIAFYFSKQWLQEFAYQTRLGFDTFLLAGVVALAIAWVTVSYQAIKAAVANPVEALRYE